MLSLKPSHFFVDICFFLTLVVSFFVQDNKALDKQYKYGFMTNWYVIITKVMFKC